MTCTIVHDLCEHYEHGYVSCYALRKMLFVDLGRLIATLLSRTTLAGRGFSILIPFKVLLSAPAPYEIQSSRSRLVVSVMPLPTNYGTPEHAFWGPAFKVLCIIAVSRDNLEHWANTTSDEYKEHSKAIVSRFHSSNLTVSLI